MGASEERACQAEETPRAKALSGNELSVLEEHKESQGSWYTRIQPTLKQNGVGKGPGENVGMIK